MGGVVRQADDQEGQGEQLLRRQAGAAAERFRRHRVAVDEGGDQGGENLRLQLRQLGLCLLALVVLVLRLAQAVQAGLQGLEEVVGADGL